MQISHLAIKMPSTKTWRCTNTTNNLTVLKPYAAATAALTVAAGTVIYERSGGDAQSRDDMGGGGGGNVNYEVLDGEGVGGGAAPRPGMVGNSAVIVGARPQLPANATNNAIYDGATQPPSNYNSSTNVIYEMGPEAEQQQQGQQQRGGRDVVVHAPPAYAVPVKIRMKTTTTTCKFLTRRVPPSSYAPDPILPDLQEGGAARQWTVLPFACLPRVRALGRARQWVGVLLI
jgi:hypothetical protein